MLQTILPIVLLPALAFVLVIFVTKKAKLLSAVIVTLSIGASFALSVVALVEKLLDPRAVELSVSWLNIPAVGLFKGLNIDMGLLLDPLSAAMLIVVTFVALLVSIYSIGYMKGDEGFSRYFAYIALFTTSMLGVVVSDNLFEMFVFWELVGLCSYLLIGFWFAKPAAVDASQKAFVTNRWADFGFMTGIILLFVHFGTFNFGQLGTLTSSSTDVAFLTLAALLIFIGPVGKSAQFPLHVWLPDAMEGPTPISALIHAATMVAAGVYMIARSYAIFMNAHTVMLIMAYLGGFTAVFAATIAIVQRDIKRILAFSTLSQLGYMIMALGIGSMTSGMFHLTTHAFFKALLFLGAGSVIHALNEQDIFKMGKLSKKMPVTTWTFVIGALALSGIFPFAGFWSKDEILSTALKSGYTGLFILGAAVAFLTAFYMFRLIFVAFFGEKKSEHHAHESGAAMLLPLVVLAVLAVVAGFVNTPWFYDLFGTSFGSFISGIAERPEINLTLAGVSVLIALSGILLAWLVYAKKAISAEKTALRFSPVYQLLWNKYYIDNLYAWLFKVLMLMTGKILDWVDHHIIDGVFDGAAKLTGWAGKKLRLTQSGYLQVYALTIFVTICVILLLSLTPILGGVTK